MKSDFIGGAIAVVSSFLSIFGVNLQKYSHDKEELRAVQRPYTMRPIWWVGMICVVGASLGDFLALGFAPQTLVASLGGGSTILGNCLMSHFWLKQSLYLTDIVGVAFVSLGVVVLAAASEEDKGHYQMDQIYELMEAAPFILYALITTAFCMTLYMRARRSKAPALRVASTDKEDARVDDVQEKKRELAAKKSKEQKNSEESPALEEPKHRGALMSPFPSPIFGDHLSLSPMGKRLPGEEDDHLEEIELSSLKIGKYDESEIEKHTLIIDPKLPLYWAAISGTVGGQSVLLAKCVVELISSTVSGDNQFQYFGTYVLCAGMAGTLLTQTHTLNLATMCGDTMSSYPVFQGFWITMSNISGVVFFQQAHNFTKTQWIMFPTAIVLVALGIFLVSKHEKFGNFVKYSIAMPISLSSPRQHDIVAQSFVFRVSTPQKLQEEDYASSTESSDSPDEHSRRTLEVV
ncbi:NIPA-like protein 2 [Phytophthora citrophthora]|uniref:NIPA-like protein 2 n=1 Tax=Phytophthora citrophthora TaxID=4793 RepID=A0AAD9G150_9STRA|nr:NIPA-like protein 2 [Phytophthora citrophthora]